MHGEPTPGSASGPGMGERASTRLPEPRVWGSVLLPPRAGAEGLGLGMPHPCVRLLRVLRRVGDGFYSRRGEQALVNSSA